MVSGYPTVMQIPDPVLVSAIVRRAVSECIANFQSPDPPSTSREAEELFHSPAAHALKEEIILTGKKLWDRQYVDGNGGNMSVRFAEEYVICTPTLCSKRDMRVEDLSLVDLENQKICGGSRPTSEILLHLEIYKAVPAAKAVVHCHPPYATAYAIAGIVPPGNLIPEQEVFVGPVALAPYETPGTMAFAKTVLPFVQDHNTILLANHGIVCWGDTITHAEWYVEVVDTYCKTVMIARQLGSPIHEIPADKIADLLAIKKRLGLPDPRLAAGETVKSNSTRPVAAQGVQTEQLVAALTSQVMLFLENKG
jgi:L-fuculose-phosphate aldolase